MSQIDNLVAGKVTEPVVWHYDDRKGDLVGEFLSYANSTLGRLNLLALLSVYGGYLYTISHNSFVFDRERRKLSYTRRKLFRQSLKEYSLDDITGIGYTRKSDLYLWIGQGHSPRHEKLLISRKLDMFELKRLTSAIGQFCPVQILEWEDTDHGYIEHGQGKLVMYFNNRLFDEESTCEVVVDKNQNKLVIKRLDKQPEAVDLAGLDSISVKVHESVDSEGEAYSKHYLVFKTISDSIDVDLPEYHPGVEVGLTKMKKMNLKLRVTD